MRWQSALAIWFLFWWLALFIVLPFERRSAGDGGTHVAGQADSAPASFSAGRVTFRTTALSLVLFGAYYLNYVNGWVGVDAFDFYN